MITLIRRVRLVNVAPSLLNNIVKLACSVLLVRQRDSIKCNISIRFVYVISNSLLIDSTWNLFTVFFFMSSLLGHSDQFHNLNVFHSCT